jgi:hypothetical protein
MTHGPLKLAIAFAVVIAVQACDDGTIVDNYGPPAGYAVLTGSISKASGTPVAQSEVLFTRCTSPIGGFLAADTTDDAGLFRVVAELPPVGVLPRSIADTLRVRCDIFVNRATVASDSVVVRFGRAPEQAPINSLRVVITP